MEIIIFLIVILLINFIGIRRLYRFLSNPSTQSSITFLESKGLIFIESRTPLKDEQNENPFYRNSNSILSIALPLTLRKHKKLIAESKKGKIHVFWIESRIYFFKKTKNEFKEIRLSIKKKKAKEFRNIVRVVNSCPGCNTNITKTVNKCPECGLVLN